MKNKDGKYLILKRFQGKYRDIKSSWDIVGGRINPGTHLVENLKREIKEETQLEITGDPVLIYAQDILRLPQTHVVRLTYIGITEGEPVLDTSENTEYKWLTIPEMKLQKSLDVYVKEILDKNIIS